MAEARYMLDTNIVLYAMRGEDGALIERLESFRVGELVSAITLGELSTDGTPASAIMRQPSRFLALVPTLPFDSAAAAGFGAVMAKLPKPKRRTYDRQIAGHALGLPVVTSDLRLHGRRGA